MLSLICARINDWVNNREAGDLRRHRGHYNVNVMRLAVVVSFPRGRTEFNYLRLLSVEKWQKMQKCMFSVDTWRDNNVIFDTIITLLLGNMSAGLAFPQNDLACNPLIYDRLISAILWSQLHRFFKHRFWSQRLSVPGFGFQKPHSFNLSFMDIHDITKLCVKLIKVRSDLTDFTAA